jgi:hypothetical protein
MMLNDWITFVLLLWIVITAIRTSYESKLYHDAIFEYRRIQRELKDANRRIEEYQDVCRKQFSEIQELKTRIEYDEM